MENSGHSRIRQEIENLALQLLLTDPPELDLPQQLRAWTGGLARLENEASTAGFSHTATAASELAHQLETSEGQEWPGVEKLLRDGIARLQESIEEGAPVQGRDVPQEYDIAQDPELLADFLVESREHLATIESQVLLMEQNPAHADAIQAVFRGFHTIKGLAGFMELKEIQEVAHETETILDLARSSRLAITPAAIDVILASADYLSHAVAAVEARLSGQVVHQADAAGLLDKIRVLAQGSAVEAGSIETEPPLPHPATEIAPSPDPPPPSGAPAPEGKPRGNQEEFFTVRIDAGKLDHLLEMVGEMVIAQTMVRQDPALIALQSPRLTRSLSQLSRITAEVQRTTMDMRMTPVNQLFSRTARLVRDLSRKTGKAVELQTRGDDTELDKTIVEAIADPIMHMVRNAVDHGIETREVRQASGKSETGRVNLSASHQGGQIVIEVADDGKGLDKDRILKKARERGLISRDAQLKDNEIFSLIFEPGFSTAEQITDVSGRGVGMDVVRKNILKLRGRIDVESILGRGTRFLLKLPLTLAIIDGLVIGVGTERYIVPVFSVREILRPAAGIVTTVENRDEIAQVRGCLLPVVRLYQRFGLKPKSENPTDCLLLVVEGAGKRFCMMVDELIGKQEVVIKSLGESLKKNVPGIAGGAILGDGRVGLILDMDRMLGAQIDA